MFLLHFKSFEFGSRVEFSISIFFSAGERTNILSGTAFMTNAVAHYYKRLQNSLIFAIVQCQFFFFVHYLFPFSNFFFFYFTPLIPPNVLKTCKCVKDTQYTTNSQVTFTFIAYVSVRARCFDVSYGDFFLSKPFFHFT